MDKIIFACVHSAGRSQMAAAFFNLLVGQARATAMSAGTQPAAHVHPEVIASMGEVGIDLSSASPARLTPELARGASWLVTMGCGDACPIVPGVKREDWPLPDPKGQSADAVRSIREAVRERVEAFVDREGYRIAIAKAGQESAPEIVSFLSANKLPEAGLREYATDLLVARDQGRLVGTAALEIHASDALLRSVAVEQSLRGTGLGQRLTRAALDVARKRGVAHVYLLTETAGGFFPRFGFADVPRSQVPESIRRTVEFASACPSSARVMMLEIK